METNVDLAVMTREPTRITVGAREIALRPMTVGELPGFLTRAAPLLAEGWEDPLKMLTRHGTAFVDLLAHVAGAESAWLREQSAGEVVRLARVFAELNEDFFVEALGPALITLVRFALRAQQAGLTSSSASSATDTAATTS